MEIGPKLGSGNALAHKVTDDCPVEHSSPTRNIDELHQMALRLMSNIESSNDRLLSMLAEFCQLTENNREEKAADKATLGCVERVRSALNLCDSMMSDNHELISKISEEL